jgi:hypothetical protein
MLKWNPQDLASRTHLQVKRIEMFERNQLRLTKPENDEIIKTFHKFHIDFRPDGEVIFLAGTPAAAADNATPREEKTYMVTLADGITQVALSKKSDWGETIPGGA